MHRFSAKGHEIKKDISMLFSAVSFSGGRKYFSRIIAKEKRKK